MWSLAFPTLETSLPESFSDNQRHLASTSGPHLGNFVYFSLATLSTLGYGDVLPVHPTALTLASLCAVSGQLFLAILVGRLVGLEIAGRTLPRDQKSMQK